MEKIMGYCVKCKKKVEIKDGKEVSKGGRNFILGVCPKCGTKVICILPSKKNIRAKAAEKLRKESK